MRIIYVDTFKGGVGKTTTARFLAASLAVLDPPVVATGLSQQNDLFGAISGKVTGLREYITKGMPLTTIPISPGLTYIPSGIRHIEHSEHNIHSLEQAIMSIADSGTKWLIVDGIHFMQSIASEMASLADNCIIPMTPDPESVSAGLSAMVSVGESKTNLLLTMVPPQSRLSATARDILELMTVGYRSVLLDTKIRFSAAREPGEGMGIRGALNSPRIKDDYMMLAKELLNGKEN